MHVTTLPGFTAYDTASARARGAGALARLGLRSNFIVIGPMFGYFSVSGETGPRKHFHMVPEPLGPNFDPQRPNIKMLKIWGARPTLWDPW